MAFVHTIDHPSGLQFVDSYWLIGAIEHQIVNRSIRIAVVGYVSAARRDQLKAASEDFEAATGVFTKAKSDWETSPPGHNREIAYDDYILADRAMKKAAQTVNDLQTLPTEAERYVISGEDYPNCLNDAGDASREKIYAWLKKQPKWIDVKDV